VSVAYHRMVRAGQALSVSSLRAWTGTDARLRIVLFVFKIIGIVLITHTILI